MGTATSEWKSRVTDQSILSIPFARTVFDLGKFLRREMKIIFVLCEPLAHRVGYLECGRRRVKRDRAALTVAKNSLVLVSVFASVFGSGEALEHPRLPSNESTTATKLARVRGDVNRFTFMSCMMFDGFFLMPRTQRAAASLWTYRSFSPEHIAVATLAVRVFIQSAQFLLFAESLVRLILLRRGL